MSTSFTSRLFLCPNIQSFVVHVNGNGFRYHFSTNGKYLFTINNQNWKKIKSASSKNEALMTITEIIDPIVKAQPKPKINLQWLFDKCYGERFK